jgi:CheY-like chemotaxis protein
MTADELVRDFGAARNQSILLVEDEVLVRALVSDDLRSEGYTVIEAANAVDALAVLGSPVRVDIVLTDMQMPGAVDGAGLVQLVRERWPFLKIVMLSGRPPDEPTRKLLDGHLPKPFVASQLKSLLRQLTDAD